jgi:chemosensory pili system protein ChpC
MRLAASIHSLLIPLQGQTLLLPNAAVAEIIPYADVQPVADAPDWYLGLMSWRNVELPLISLDQVLREEPPMIGPQSRIVVLNAVAKQGKMTFYGIISQGIPHLVQVTRETMAAIGPPDASASIATLPVTVGGEEAAIPDMTALEEMVYGQFGAVTG